MLEFVSIDVVACVGGFLGAAVYRARLRQAQLIHEFRTSTSEGSDDVARLYLRQAQLIHEFRTRTSEGSDDVARLCLVDADWDMTVAVGRFLTGMPEGVPPQGGE
jgi:hypothetical protein